MLKPGDIDVSAQSPTIDLAGASLRSFEDSHIAGPPALTANRAGQLTVAGGGNEVPVLRGNPNATPPEYPGGIGDDVNDTRRAIGALGPEARMMFELFERTYNSRAGENILPGNLPLKEVDPARRANIVKWELLGDSQIYQPKNALGGRDLKPISDVNPGSSKNPGHMYAIGYNKDGLPSDVLEYYRDTTANKVVYQKQYQIDCRQLPPGGAVGFIFDVKELWAPGQTRNFGAKQNIAGIEHTLGGVTRWYEGPKSNFVGVEQFNGWQPDKPRMRMNFNGAAVETQTIRPDGSYNNESYLGPNATWKLAQISPNFYFYDLFGPPKQ
jgi:hypothetical protein